MEGVYWDRLDQKGQDAMMTANKLHAETMKTSVNFLFHQPKLKLTDASFFQSGIGSDFIVKGATKQFKVHKFVLRQSSYFAATCDGAFKVSKPMKYAK